MQNALIFTNKPPVTTMTVDTTVFMGRNQIRRNVGRNTSLYIVGTVTDDYLHMRPGDRVELNTYFVPACDDSDVFEEISKERFSSERLIEAIVIQVDQPIVVQVNDQLPIFVRRIFTLDSPSRSITLHNPHDVEATVHVTYATTQAGTEKIRVNSLGIMTIDDAVQGFVVSGLASTPYVTLTLNNYVVTVTVPDDQEWSVTIPEEVVSTPGEVFVIARHGNASDAVRLIVTE